MIKHFKRRKVFKKKREKTTRKLTLEDILYVRKIKETILRR